MKMAGPRVAYILLWFPERSQTFILDEVNTLARLGLDLSVYTLYGPSPRPVTGMAPVAAPVHRLGLSSLKGILQENFLLTKNWGASARPFLRRVLVRKWRSPETGAEALWAALAGVHLARRFLADGMDHIHAPWANGPATGAWVASQLSGIPFSFCAHAHDLYPPDGALADKLKAAAFVRAVSAENVDFLAALVPAAAAKIVKIYYGAPLTGASRKPRPFQHPCRLLALGRLVPKKGFGILLESCRLLAQQGVDFHLTLAGDGPELKTLQEMIRRFGLESRVSLPGFVPHNQVPRLLQEADLFLMPSVILPHGDRDGLPNVILEAMGHGVPVIATPVNGIPEAIYPGETGWLVPPGDPVALARAVREALAHPEEAQRRALKGRELVGREFDSRKNYGRLKVCLEGAVRQV